MRPSTTRAVFQVSGQMEDARILSADRIMILTEYITVQSWECSTWAA